MLLLYDHFCRSVCSMISAVAVTDISLDPNIHFCNDRIFCTGNIECSVYQYTVFGVDGLRFGSRVAFLPVVLCYLLVIVDRTAFDHPYFSCAALQADGIVDFYFSPQSLPRLQCLDQSFCC